MNKRVQVLEKECTRLDLIDSDMKTKPPNIYVNDQYKLIFCTVPKIASTNFKRLLLVLSGKFNITDPNQIKEPQRYARSILPKLYMLPLSEREYRIRHYNKVIFTREPFARVVSAYKDKFLHSRFPYYSIENTIIERYRINGSIYLRNISFSEFVEYIVDPFTTSKYRYNQHWKPIFDMCYPCKIHYNYIGKVDSMDRDVHELIKMLKVEDRVHFPLREDRYHRAKSEEELWTYYKDVKPDLIRQLYNRYTKDYAVFNFNLAEEIIQYM